MRKEERHEKAAKMLLEAGDIKGYCDIMCNLGKWVDALLVAPAAGEKYWRDIMTRSEDFLKNALLSF